MLSAVKAEGIGHVSVKPPKITLAIKLIVVPEGGLVGSGLVPSL